LNTYLDDVYGEVRFISSPEFISSEGNCYFNRFFPTVIFDIAFSIAVWLC